MWFQLTCYGNQVLFLHSLYDKSLQKRLIYGDKHPPDSDAQCIIVNFLFITNPRYVEWLSRAAVIHVNIQ